MKVMLDGQGADEVLGGYHFYFPVVAAEILRRRGLAYSIEARVPFLDHRLVELAFGLRTDQKIRGATTKWILREALAGTLPERIRTRTDKIGFRADPGVTWELARRHRSSLVESRTEHEREWLDAGRAAALVDGADRSSTAEFALWRLISAKLWLRGRDGEGLA